jgi:allophanate hydrolase subunit 1
VADRPAPRIERLGDAALLVTLADEVDLEVNDLARRLAAILDARRPPVGVPARPVSGHASVLVPFDPDAEDEAAVRTLVEAAVHEALGAGAGEAPGVLHELPVAYGGADGPDLAEVARTGLSEAAVVRSRVSSTRPVVRFVRALPRPRRPS